MLIGLIRPVETETAEVTGTSLEDVQDRLETLRLPGFSLVSAPVRMLKGEAMMQATGTFRRVDGITEITGEDMPALLEQVPDGWQLLSVRRA